MMRTPLGLASVICLPLMILLIGLVVWNPIGNFWKSVESPKAQVEAYDPVRMQADQTLTSAIYDQRRLDRLIREPQNTVSNLAYFLVGLAILFAASKPASINLGLAGMFLGFGSGVYHASLLAEWRLIDILGVYGVLYLLLLVGLMSSLPRFDRGLPGWLVSLVVWFVAIYTGVHRNDVRWFGLKVFDSTYVFVAAVALGCLLAMLAYRRAANRRRCGWALVALAVSASISFAGGVGDRFQGFWAAPNAFLQGHAIWHTFGAVALLATYEVFAAAGFDCSTLSADISKT